MGGRVPMLRARHVACLLLLAAAGCVYPSVPPGYRKVKAMIRLKSRSLAVIPFLSRNPKKFTPRDGVNLAYYMVKDLSAALPKRRFVGPTEMAAALQTDIDARNWPAIGRKLGVAALVVGEVTIFDSWEDKQMGSREGVIGIRLRVLDVSGSVPKRIASLRESRFQFPPGTGGRFDPRYTTMEDAVFRREMLKYAARQVARFFYDHLERTKSVSKFRADTL